MSDETRDRDVDRFGRWADSYQESILQRLVFAPLQELTLREAEASIPNPKSILDIGCGTGLLLHKAARRFPSSELTGVDAAEDMIRVAQASVPEGIPVHFVQAFAEQLPFPNKVFDLVVTTMSFHHWADQRKALREVQRVLLPGGVLALADAMHVGWLSWLLAPSKHGRFNKPSMLEGMLWGAGFDVEQIIPISRFGGTIRIIIAHARHVA